MPSKSVPSGSGIAKSSWVRVKVINILATTYIEEYVPIKTPKIKAKLNPLINSPPKIKSANKTNKVVKDVTIVLPRVWLSDRSI